jgi:outer membrane receptor for monomeric catechols
MHRETNLMDTPSGISAISEEMIQELGAESAADLFQHIAGLNFTSEEVGASRYAVRGVSSQVGANQ